MGNEHKIETLFENEWLQTKIVTTEKNGSYVYSTCDKNKNKGVAILPYKFNLGKREMSFLGRYEYCPAHSPEETRFELCTITGGYDNEKISLKECAINELIEEAGYKPKNDDDVMELGSIKPSKTSNVEVFLFAIDINKCEKVEATSDGTVGEVGAYCEFVSISDAVWCKDPIMATMINRFIEKELVQNGK